MFQITLVVQDLNQVWALSSVSITLLKEENDLVASFSQLNAPFFKFILLHAFLTMLNHHLQWWLWAYCLLFLVLGLNAVWCFPTQNIFTLLILCVKNIYMGKLVKCFLASNILRFLVNEFLFKIYLKLSVECSIFSKTEARGLPLTPEALTVLPPFTLITFNAEDLNGENCKSEVAKTWIGFLCCNDNCRGFCCFASLPLLIFPFPMTNRMKRRIQQILILHML